MKLKDLPKSQQPDYGKLLLATQISKKGDSIYLDDDGTVVVLSQSRSGRLIVSSHTNRNPTYEVELSRLRLICNVENTNTNKDFELTVDEMIEKLREMELPDTDDMVIPLPLKHFQQL